MIKAIILDCFGVLVGRGFDETYRTAGGDPDADREFINDILGQTNLGLLSEPEFRTAVAEKLGITIAEYRAVLQRVEQPNMDLLNLVKSLRGQYKIAMLSNANNGLTEYLEAKPGVGKLEQYFDEIILSSEVGMVKPHPEIYNLAAEKLGVQPEACVFIDDHEALAAGAKAVGMKTILYKDFAQTKAELEQIFNQS